MGESSIPTEQGAPKMEKPSAPKPEGFSGEKPSLGKPEQRIVDRIDKDGDEDQVLKDIATTQGEEAVNNENAESDSHFYKIEETDEGFKVTTPGGYTDRGAFTTYSRIVGSREEAETILEKSKRELGPRTERASLQKSFSTFHSIEQSPEGKYVVTFPAFHSMEDPHVLVGTSTKAFDTWGEARDFYLESRNKNEFPEDLVFQFNIDGIDYKFTNVEKFGQKPRLSDRPIEISDTVRAVLDFDKRNDPSENPNASTYMKTTEIPDWQSQLFSFVRNFTATPEGQQVIKKLRIKNLELLTPNQAVNLTLETVMRFRKYYDQEIVSQKGDLAADGNSALALLNEGLRNRDKTDFKGNGVCRNFASTVKATFEAIKANQTPFNYLHDTYAFYDGGSQDEFDPDYKPPNPSDIYKKDNSPRHAWNSFVTIGKDGVSQTMADTTWAKFDYDTQKPIGLDFTLQRMERDIYRNLQRKGSEMDSEQAAQFYVFLLDQMTTNESRSTIPQGNRESRSKFYLKRALGAIRGKTSSISESSARGLGDHFLRNKDFLPTSSEVETIFNLPNIEDSLKQRAANKYLRAFEAEYSTIMGQFLVNDKLSFKNEGIRKEIWRMAIPKVKKLLARHPDYKQFVEQ